MTDFSWLQKWEIDKDDCFMSDGRVFHSDGPATEKLRGLKPTVLVLYYQVLKQTSHYCDNVLQQGLLPDIRCLSNDDFMFQQDGAPAHRSCHTMLPCTRSSLSWKTGRQTVRI